MSLARGDTGEIRDFHSKASGLARNLRDASGRTGRMYVNSSSYQSIRSYKLGAFEQMAADANGNSDPWKGKSVQTSLLRRVE